jgi:hypothetical protein
VTVSATFFLIQPEYAHSSSSWQLTYIAPVPILIWSRVCHTPLLAIIIRFADQRCSLFECAIDDIRGIKWQLMSALGTRKLAQ